MNTRNLILGIAAILVIAGGFLTAALLLGGEPQPEPTAPPASTVDIGPAPSADPTGDPATDPTAAEPGTTAPPATDEDDHRHDHGDSDDCETGPVSCEDDDDVIYATDTDKKAADAVRGRVAPFVVAFTTVNSTETPAARATRLTAAGADGTVAGLDSMIARKNSTQTGLTATSTPQNPTRVLFIGRDGGLLKFQASINVDAKYMQADGSGSFHTAGGAVYVWMDDAGTVKKVSEDFPTIKGLR